MQPGSCARSPIQPLADTVLHRTKSSSIISSTSRPQNTPDEGKDPSLQQKGNAKSIESKKENKEEALGTQAHTWAEAEERQDRSQRRARREVACCPRLVSYCRRHRHVPPFLSLPFTHPTTAPPPYLPYPPHTNAHLDHFLPSLHRYVPTPPHATTPRAPPVCSRNGAAAAGVLRQGQRDGLGARPGGGAGPGAGAGGALLLAGVRSVAGGGRGGGAAGAGVVRRGVRGGGAGVPRGLLGLPWLEGPFRVQRVDRAAEGLRGGAPARHALHAAGRRAGPRALRRHRAGRARAGRPRRATVPIARHEGDFPAAQPDHTAGVLHGRAARPRGRRRRRERAGGAVREWAGHRLRPRREQGQVAAQRPRGAPAGEGGRGAGRRLGAEDRVGVRAVPALGRLPRHQVRPRPLRAERRAAGARRPALRSARQRVSAAPSVGVRDVQGARRVCDILCRV